MSTITFDEKLSAVSDYLLSGSSDWSKMKIDTLTTDQINAMFNSLPSSRYTVTRSVDGLVLGREYTSPFDLPVVPGTEFDSNIPGGSYSGGNSFTGSIPGSIVTDPTTGQPLQILPGGSKTDGSFLPALADKVSLAVAGVNIGAKLGLKIDSALYNKYPDFWNDVLPTVNPATWNSLVGINPVGDFFLRVLFGIDGDMTGYLSEEALAYYYKMLRDIGAFNEGTNPDTATSDIPGIKNSDYDNMPVNSSGSLAVTWTSSWSYHTDTYSSSGAGCTAYYISTGYSDLIIFASTQQNTLITKTSTDIDKSSGRVYTSTDYFRTNMSYTYDSTIVWYTNMQNNRASITDYMISIGASVGTLPSSSLYGPIAWTITHGTITPGGSPVEGIDKLPQSTQYPPTNITGTTTQEVLDQLKQQYPDLFQDAITESTMQDDGTVTTTTYVPIPWTTEGTDDEQATTGEGKGQTDTQVDEETGQQTMPTTPQDEQTQPPDTGEGSAPVPPVPTGSASSLWAVYNPSQGELNSFGAWLWSSNFVEQIKKLFADPMQAIIGVHKVFASPHTGGSQTIKCGYLDSGVSASVVTSQYTTVDCGSASLREYFGNVFDYDPFTKISIFLPFIGIVPLNTADVMRSTVSVKYKVDVITGACLAEVNISRDGGGGILYTYGGSAIVTYPVSSGSYVGAVQAALSTALGIGSAIATGGASLGASAGMVLGGLANAKTQVQHSGQFSGSSGAMGGKKPYLIVSRPQTRVPSKISEYKGIPSTSIHKLSSCEGFVKVQEVHIASKTAYDNEIQEIENLLKAGVII